MNQKAILKEVKEVETLILEFQEQYAFHSSFDFMNEHLFNIKQLINE